MYNLINRGLDLHGTFSLYRDGKLNEFDLHNLSDEDVATIKELCQCVTFSTHKENVA